MSNQAPSFRPTVDGVRVTHREYLGDVVGSVGFSMPTAYPINPGMAVTFPWLSTISSAFEEYSFEGLVFEYKTTSGSAVSASSAALGAVIMATNYDVADANFISKQDMESYEFAVSVVPFQNCLHPVECNPSRNVLGRQYTRFGAVGSEDLRFYDMGNFQLATQGMQSVYTCGELWVTYDIRLLKPRINPLLPAGPSSYAHVQSSAIHTATSAAPLGTTGGVVTSNSTLTGVTCGTATIVVSNPGYYGLTAAWVSSNIGAVPAVSPGSSISGIACLENGTSINFEASFTSTNALFLYMFKVSSQGTGAANTITLSGLTSMTAGDCDLFLYALPSVNPI
jgi:hypothetical protein